jgi:hypothetical protein
VSCLPGRAYRADDDLDRQAKDNQVGDHLARDDQPDHGGDVEPVSGIEPLTCRLQDGRSAN